MLTDNKVWFYELVIKNVRNLISMFELGLAVVPYWLMPKNQLRHSHGDGRDVKLS